ncbi:MAG: DNA-3-methyladenine glycosylase 2 family protein [Ginsengibacter sp.]
MLSIVNDADVKSLITKDKIISSIYKQYGAPPKWSRPQGFVTLSKMILEQQVSLASAKAHFIKLNTYLQTFTPEDILKLTDDEMHNCQVSRQKSTYLRALSKAILNTDLQLNHLPELEEGDIRKQLTNIKGIGTWTTDVYLMFSLQAKDIFPLGDVAVVTTMKELTGAQTKDDMLIIAEKWRPLRSLATYFLWHYYLHKRNRTYLVE